MPTVHDALPFPADFEFAQKCVEGDSAAIEALQCEYGPIIAAYLVHRGASARQAHDLTDGLWTDCLTPRAGRGARLATYNGHAPLATWLKTVALNQLISLHEEEKRRQETSIDEQLSHASSSSPELAAPGPPTEAPLLVLMRTALEVAFQRCPAEDFVLLQLAHSDGLLLEELARMFNCAPSTISRRLVAAQGCIQVEVIRYIRQVDPLIALKWEDFVELCRVASPACFGVE